MTPRIVRVLGWLVIAHGLAHAVSPLQGSRGGAVAIDDWIPIGLYAIGVAGFVAAGMGLVGLRPLDVAISPLLVLASGLSLVAIIRFADSTLLFGATCDALLLFLGLRQGYRGWPAHPTPGTGGIFRRLGESPQRRGGDLAKREGIAGFSLPAEAARRLP